MSANEIRVLDLFSGIGGFSLGLEMASPRFRTVLFCERDAFCRRVLAKHWPEVPQHDDIRTLDAAALAAVGPVRAIAGGFPCQDISVAGQGAGLEGERSGLWFEMHRVIDLVRPRWCLVENVPALRSRGGDRVISDLEASGYTVWPSVVGAVHAGAPHRRQRVWILAHADSERRNERRQAGGPEAGAGTRPERGRGTLAHAETLGPSAGASQPRRGRAQAEPQRRDRGRHDHVGLAGLAGLPIGQGPAGQRAHAATAGAGGWRAESGLGGEADGLPPGLDGPSGVMWPTPGGFAGGQTSRSGDRRDEPAGLQGAVRFWPTPNAGDSKYGRPATMHEAIERHAANGVNKQVGLRDDVLLRQPAQEPWERGIPRTVGKGFPNRVPRLQALGNAVVPQVVAMFGRWIAMVEAAGE